MENETRQRISGLYLIIKGTHIDHHPDNPDDPHEVWINVGNTSAYDHSYLERRRARKELKRYARYGDKEESELAKRELKMIKSTDVDLTSNPLFWLGFAIGTIPLLISYYYYHK